MLYGLSKQIAHCYFRAGECRELAARSVSTTDRQFYFEREQAWLVLARSYEFQERLSQMIKELERQSQRGYLTPTRNIVTVIHPPACPACSIGMQLLATQPAKHMFVQATTIFERAFFLCPNCWCVSDRLLAMPRE